MTTDADQPPFTCPTCGAVSHQREDIEQRYCGRCRWWTGDPVLGKVYPYLSDPLVRRLARLLDRFRGQMLADDLEVLIPAGDIADRGVALMGLPVRAVEGIDCWYLAHRLPKDSV